MMGCQGCLVGELFCGIPLVDIESVVGELLYYEEMVEIEMDDWSDGVFLT